MKEIEVEKWKLENYSRENLKGAVIYYTRKRLIDIFLGLLEGDNNHIRKAKLLDINEKRDCIKICREENGYEGWVSINRINFNRIVKEDIK